MEVVRLKCGFENGIDVGAIGSSEGLSFGWKGNSLVNFKSFSSFHIDAKIHDNECGEVWRLTGFYGGRLRSEWKMNEFRTTLEDCNLSDLGFVGRWFTWESGKFLASNIRERLDREWGEDSGSVNVKLEKLGRRLQQWSFFKNRMDRKQRMILEDRLNYLYNQDPSDEILAEITDVQMSLNWEADKEELFWEQRARVNWLKNGDRNTSYFHKVAVNRQFRGRILALEDENGRQLSSTDDFLRLASDYFGNLFTASNMGPDDHLFGLMEEKVTESMNANLIKQFTVDEIAHAVKMMSPLHAPGVDVFPAIFFQRYWHILGPEISSYCLSILNGNCEIGGINETRIVLILKVEKLKNMSQFRHISLYNVIYKIIAKVLVFWMSDMLGYCINEAQGAFVPGRLISDNVLIAYEVLHSLKMKKRGQKGNFALKLDMSKAYDRVEWNFLAGMMKHLGFHEEGSRQWDPLSPFLFLICAEGFSILIEEAKQKGLMKGAPISRARFSINHLFFADDSILFGDASCEGAKAVRDIINEYELISGQRVNFEKSLIYFGANVNLEVKENIVNMLGVRVAHNPEKYLGLPMMVGRKKSWAFANFADRFRKRIEGWSLRYLSIGGKEIFIKSVLQAIPLYAMQCFLMSKSFCRKLEGIMNKFWWTNNKSSKGIHWRGWEPLCKPKDAGGMGFKDLVLFNKALLAKQVWRILTQPKCLLAKVLKALYYPHFDILAAKIGSYPSFTWRSICSARELIENGLLWRVGNGSGINIWNDPWLPGRENNRVSIQRILPNWTTVNQLINCETFTWNEELILNIFDVDTAKRILSIPIAEGRSEDLRVWKYEGSGEYTVKSGYQVLSSEYLQNTTVTFPDGVIYFEFYKSLWALHNPAKIKIYTWRLFNNFLPHLCNLVRKTLSVEIVCPLCKEGPEDADHLMWSCEILQSVWKSLNIMAPSFESSIGGKICFANTFFAANEQQRQMMAFSLWGFWYRKNKLFHEGVKFSLQEILGFLKGYSQELNLNWEIFFPSFRSLVNEIWKPPDGFIKLNFDAAFQNDIKLAITAVLARNSEGDIVGAETYLFKDVTNAFVAEARACERALILAAALGFRQNGKSVLRPITQHIFFLEAGFEEIFYLFVLHLVNDAAHTLALEGRRRQAFRVWSDRVPDSVQALALKDRLAWNHRLQGVF
ncbi:reverse transcriptase [Gossypium australe]|uniref:Reverse transcriptase n=1 Tax=Gossypium australe TaxID=47621 RepID=A0A5B6UKK9_9ROSI|nr:reverse transcriptase [Gossypium australe]